jgi:hypothetical protein
VFLHNAIAIAGPLTHSYNDYSGNGSLGSGVSMGAGEIATAPSFDTGTYGTGAYLMPPTNLTSPGQGGTYMGAKIVCETVNGSLTSTPLWPWPMESRIFALTATSPTYAASGGVWKTLSGMTSC